MSHTSRLGSAVLVLLLLASGCREQPAVQPKAPDVIVTPAEAAVFEIYTPSISNVRAYDSVDLVARV